MESTEESSSKRLSTRVGNVECLNFDEEVVHGIMDELLRAVAAASLEKSSSGFFRQSGSEAEEARKELFEFLEKRSSTVTVDSPKARSRVSSSPDSSASGPGPSEKPPDSSAVLGSQEIRKLLVEFVDCQRSILTRISSAFYGQEGSTGGPSKFQSKLHELQSTKFWEDRFRENLAKGLLRRLDVDYKEHCGKKFGDEAALQSHATECEFRPIVCENPGCGKCVSWLKKELHDGICPFKPLPCRQECGSMVQRSGMEAHCGGECPMRRMTCPFKPLGCDKELVQKDLEGHCSTSLLIHVTLLLQGQVHQRDEAALLVHRVSLLEQALTLAERSDRLELKTLQMKLKEVTTKLNIVELELTRAKQDVKSLKVENKQVGVVKREVKELQKMALTPKNPGG